MERLPVLELFSGELRRLRTAAGLSQEALGEKINYSASGAAPDLGIGARRGDAAPADHHDDRRGGKGMDLTGARWHKSTRSSGNSGNCVEVADNLPEVVAVRDSKDRQGPVLVFDRAVWSRFVASVKHD